MLKTIASGAASLCFCLASALAAPQTPSCDADPTATSCVPIKGCLKDGRRFAGVVRTQTAPIRSERADIVFDTGMPCSVTVYWTSDGGGEIAGACDTGPAAGFGLTGAFEIVPSGDVVRFAGETPFESFQGAARIGATPADDAADLCPADLVS